MRCPADARPLYPAPCPGRRGVEVDASGEERSLADDGGRDGVPQAEPHLHRAKRQRQVWPLAHEVEHPVREHEPAEHPGPATGARPQPIVEREQSCPYEHHEQAARPRVVERREGGVAGLHPDLLHADEDQDRPHQVEELCGREEGPQRGARRDALGGEPDREVPDEHAGGLAGAACCQSSDSLPLGAARRASSARILMHAGQVTSEACLTTWTSGSSLPQYGRPVSLLA